MAKQEWNCEELPQQFHSTAQAQTPWPWYNTEQWQPRFEQSGDFHPTAVAAFTTPVAEDVTPRGPLAKPALLWPNCLNDPSPLPSVSLAAPSRTREDREIGLSSVG